MAQRRERFRARARRMAPGHRQRAARLRRHRRRAAVRAGRCREHLRRDLLQQRRLHRHVRPRHHRPRRHARASGPHAARRSSDRNARRHRHRDAACRRRGDRGQRAVVSPRGAGGRRSSRGTASCTATWRGAATGFSCAATTACRSRRARCRLDRVRGPRARRACASRRHRAGRRGDRSHRTLRPAGRPAQRRAQFRALPRRRLRSLALRHRHQRQAGLPRRRRQAGARRTWRQESVIGSVFTGHYAVLPTTLPDMPVSAVLPFIHGRAFVTLDANLVFDAADPFAWGCVERSLLARRVASTLRLTASPAAAAVGR